MDSAKRKPEETVRNWLELPRDATRTIFVKLGAFEILNTAQKVCWLWYRISREPILWRSITLCNVIDGYDFDALCRCAVDRSDGQLTDICIESFGNDDLLNYISYSAINLRSLRIISCSQMTDVGLVRLVAKHRMLQNVELSYCSFRKVALETAGRFCPLINSFKWNNQWCTCPDWDHHHQQRNGYDDDCPHRALAKIEHNEVAFAIASNMRELRQLQLVGNLLSNDGLQAIVHGCPHLESLDIRQCFNISLKGSLKAQCMRIKYLRPPEDCTEDYEYSDKIHYDYEYESFDDDDGDDDFLDSDLKLYPMMMIDFRVG